jgi:transposase
MQVAVEDHVYALENRVERYFNKLKNTRRLATRYDQMAAS